MTKFKSFLSAALAAVAATGCAHFSSGNRTADFPEAEQFPQIYQAKMMAAAHWQLIAENEAKLLARRFRANSTFSVATPSQTQTSVSQSDFAVAYQNMLSQGLLNNNMRVFERGAEYDLSFHVQVLRHGERSQRNLPVGLFTGTTVAAFLLKAGLQISRPEIMLLPAALGADAFNQTNSDTETPNTEIVLTTSARARDELVYSNSSIYYFRATDQTLYDGIRPPAQVIEPRPGFRVSGPKG